MQLIRFRAVLAGLFVLLPVLASAQAEDAPFSHVAFAVKLSTLGVGVEGATPVLPRANLRVGFNVFSLSHTFDRDGISLDTRLKARSVEAEFDWFPWGGGFHISPGILLYNGNRIEAVASVPPNKKFSLGDQDLISNPANPVKGNLTVDYRKVAPSVAIGWGNLLPKGGRRWSVPFEMGLIFTREPRAALSLNGSACATNGTNCRNVATDAGLQAEVTKEQNDLNSDIKVLKVFPILSLGFSYRF